MNLGCTYKGLENMDLTLSNQELEAIYKENMRIMAIVVNNFGIYNKIIEAITQDDSKTQKGL